MKNFVFPALAMCLSACSFYHPLKHEGPLYKGAFSARRAAGVRITFLGNTTIHLTDGRTSLLVDGFLSRPSKLQSLLGQLKPDPKFIDDELRRAGITQVDAVLVGHAHHDHALDAPTICKLKGACVMGNRSYSFFHEGEKAPKDKLIDVTGKGRQETFGDFTITFVESEHVHSHNFVQRKIEGEVTAPFATPARMADFKCGDVYAIHISHPLGGKVLITTTAGAKWNALADRKADVAFLGIGFLGQEGKEWQDWYWNETVEKTGARTIIPVHWDDFSKRPTSSGGLKCTPFLIDNTKASLAALKTRAKKGEHDLRLMGLRDSFLLRNGQVLIEGKQRGTNEKGMILR
ncbi:MAG: MBL fold metallo-hydrolase [Prosthecobacter sp.]